MIKINRQSSNLKRFLHDFEKKKQHVDGGKITHCRFLQASYYKTFNAEI